MVEVKHNLRLLPTELLCILHSTLCHIAQKGLVSVVACALGNLEDNWRLCLGRSLDDSLKLLHIVEIECRDCISACNGLCEHLTGVYKTKFFVRYHNSIIRI